MFTLDELTKDKIVQFLPKFEEWMRTDEAKEFVNEREERERKFRALLDANSIGQLTEPDYRQIIASLWAYAGWTNKEYLADRMLKSVDFEDLKAELKNLLYGHAPLHERYDQFFRKVRGIGPAGVTEIMAFARAESCGIWNDKSRRGLEMLGLGQRLPTEKYKIDGKEYERLNEVLTAILTVLKPKEEKKDLLYVDLFLYYLAMKPEEQVEEEDYDFDHDEIVDKLVAVGNGLGFEADSEQHVAIGARVDIR